MNDNDKAVLKALVLKRTEELRQKYYVVPESVSSGDPVVDRVNAFLGKDANTFVSYRADVVGLMNALFGDKIKDPFTVDGGDGINWKRWAMAAVRPVGSSDSYRESLTYVVVTLGRAADFDGDTGSTMSANPRNWRPATAEEIESLFHGARSGFFDKIEDYAGSVIDIAGAVPALAEAVAVAQG